MADDKLSVADDDYEFEVAIEERVDWEVDGSDSMIASVNKLIDDCPESNRTAMLMLWAVQMGENFARNLGTFLHHGVFVITSDLETLHQWGIMPEHQDCEKCQESLLGAEAALVKNPSLVLAIGHLYWSSQP